MNAIQQLIILARAYGAAEKLEPVTVSWRVFGDSKKLAAIESGGADIQMKRYEKALRWFSENWPAGAEWPADIARPVDAPAEASA